MGPYSLQSTEPTVVMVVDDDQEIREVLREVLEQEGHVVVEAENGREALTYLSTHTAPHVILLDLFMPVMDGWQFMKQLRSNATLVQIPVVVVTASGSHWGYPTDRVIRKPFDSNQLLQALRDVGVASAPH